MSAGISRIAAWLWMTEEPGCAHEVVSRSALLRRLTVVALFCLASASMQVHVGNVVVEAGLAAPVPYGLVAIVVGGAQIVHVTLWLLSAALIVAGYRFVGSPRAGADLQLIVSITAQAQLPLLVWAISSFACAVYLDYAGILPERVSVQAFLSGVSTGRGTAYLSGYLYLLHLLARTTGIPRRAAVVVTVPFLCFVAVLNVVGLAASMVG